MAQRIFIACASETKESHAMPIAHALGDVGFEVKRWWTEFKPGDFTLERLVQLSYDVQGAVFICVGTDQTWYHGKKTVQARDNVIFELGLFLSQLEPSLAVVVSDEGTQLPSDLSGMTYIRATEDTTTLAERVATHFKNQFQTRKSKSSLSPRMISIEVDPDVGEASIKSPAPPGWHQRALYLGTEGARGWMAIVKHGGYPTSTSLDLVRTQTFDVLKGISISTFVSLGPGDGVIDREVAIFLSSKETELIYLPVDISEGLLFHAARLLSAHVQVPVGILGDFEERLPFVVDRLRARINQPVLVGVLGGTLGNLDRFEATFLRQLQSWLGKGDFVILEVTAADEGISPQDMGLPDSSEARRFLANGISWQSGIPIEDILVGFNERLERREGRSDVPGTVSIDFIDRHTGVKVQNMRCYDWKSFLKWIKEGFGFEVVKERKGRWTGMKFGPGMVLLRRI